MRSLRLRLTVTVSVRPRRVLQLERDGEQAIQGKAGLIGKKKDIGSVSFLFVYLGCEFINDNFDVFVC